MLQALSYPKTQSFIEAFESNSSSSALKFQHVTELLFWLTHLYDPTMFSNNFKFHIEEENHRINFINFVVNELNTRDNIQLNSIHLYKADDSAILELNKLISVLYRAISQHDNHERQSGQSIDSIKELTFIVDNSIQGMNDCASRMSQLGMSIDPMSLVYLKSQISSCTYHFQKILSAYDSVARVQTHVASDNLQRDIVHLLDAVSHDENLEKKKCRRLALEEEDILERINKTSTELISKRRQLESLQGTQPVFMDEYNEVEKELQEYYRMFVTNLKNIYFLKEELDLHNDTRFLDKTMDDVNDVTDRRVLEMEDTSRNHDYNNQPHHGLDISAKDHRDFVNFSFKKGKPDSSSEKVETITMFSRGGVTTPNISSVSETEAGEEVFDDSSMSDYNTQSIDDHEQDEVSSDDDF